MKYRKKPEIVDAWKFELDKKFPDFIEQAVQAGIIYPRVAFDNELVMQLGTSFDDIEVEEANLGDYIVRDEHGRFVSYSPKEFESLFESIDN